MRLSYQEQGSKRTEFAWPQLRLPHIRIAVPSILDDVKRQPEQKKILNTQHRELLDEFRRDMDGFMPLAAPRRKAKKR